MLRIVGVKHVNGQVVETGDYVPLTLGFGDESQVHIGHLHWRALHGDRPVLEITADDISHVIRSVILELKDPSRIVPCTIDSRSQRARVERGVPVCDASQWEGRVVVGTGGVAARGIVDEQHEVTVCIGNDSVVLTVGADSSEPAWYAVAGCVWFGMNERDELCRMQVTELTEKDIRRIQVACGLP